MAKPQNNTQKKAQAQQVKNPVQKKALKIRTSTKFHRNQTKKTASKPQIMKSISAEINRQSKQKLDQYSVLINPVQSDKCLYNLENRNTIVYQVDPRANKTQIKQAFLQLHKLPVRKVNTVNRIGCGKRAYIRLENDKDALNVASKIGLL